MDPAATGDTPSDRAGDDKTETIASWAAPTGAVSAAEATTAWPGPPQSGIPSDSAARDAWASPGSASWSGATPAGGARPAAGQPGHGQPPPYAQPGAGWPDHGQAANSPPAYDPASASSGYHQPDGPPFHEPPTVDGRPDPDWAGYGQPGYGPPRYGEPPYDPTHAQANYGPPTAYGPPGQDASPYGQPGYPPQQGAGQPGFPPGGYGPQPPTAYAPWPPHGGPPPRRGPGVLIALVTVGVLLLAGLGAGTYFLVRGLAPTGDNSAAAPTGQPPDPGGRPAAPADPGSVRTVRTPTLTYSVPANWVASDDIVNEQLGVTFSGSANAPGYDCGGSSYLRGIATSTVVPGPEAAPDVAARFAQELGSAYYTNAAATPPAVEVTRRQQIDVDGTQSALVEVTSRTPGDDGCLATGGTVLLLAVPITAASGPATAVLVVNGDTTGGPPSPPAPDRSTLEAIINSTQLTVI